ARLFNETREALEKQTATADILQVLSGSPSDTQPVFDAIVRHAARLCDSTYANVFRYDGERIHLAASQGGSPEALAALRDAYPKLPDRKRAIGRVIESGHPVHIEDTFADADYDQTFAGMLKLRRLLGVPLLRAGRPVGGITVAWAEPGRISPRHEDLLKTFADQAVIAIENVRLFNETKEALERQTATAEILKVIASSPSDVQPVFDTIVKSARSLCKGMYANVFRYDGELLHFMATESLVPRAMDLMRAKYPMRPDASQASGRVILSGMDVRIEDVSRDPDYDPRLVVTGGPRSMLAVPMMREGAPVGVIVVAWGEPGPILKHHEELLQTFADQAVIAIENVRLFNETNEALARQTASADILRVISGSPMDVKPVFHAIVEAAVRLLACDMALVLRCEGGTYSPVAGATPGGPMQDMGPSNLPVNPALNFPSRAIVSGAMLHLPDWSAIELPDHERRIREALGISAALYLPLLRADLCVGVLVYGRNEAHAFSEKEIGLAESFRDQAMIAIENVRLFNETTEALEQQRASGEVLSVISNSIADAQPVFEKIVESCERLFSGAKVGLNVIGPDGLVHA
ncbi:MAG: GAF domain-containing protein, partial [Bradyrhizobium sp.]